MAVSGWQAREVATTRNTMRSVPLAEMLANHGGAA